MDAAEFWAIRAGDSEIENPISPEKLNLVTEYCEVRNGLHVLEIGCGKAWLLRQWAEQYEIEAIGLDINAHFLAAAGDLAQRAGISHRLRLIEGPALDFKVEPESQDIVLCLGASSALGGVEPAIKWISSALKPHGVLAFGVAFANEKPLPPEHSDELILDLAETAAALRACNLELTAVIGASPDDWDRFRSRQWHNIYAWLRANPAHPQREQVSKRIEQEKQRYLGFQRRYLGWAIFVARRASI
jgi:ubiquinone/menaquinone biosynthesis C-methylase UbiE